MNDTITIEQLVYIFNNNPRYEFRTAGENALCWVKRIMIDKAPFFVWRFYIETGDFQTPIEIELNDETEIRVKDGVIIITAERRESIDVHAYQRVREFEIPSANFAKKLACYA